MGEEKRYPLCFALFLPAGGGGASLKLVDREMRVEGTNMLAVLQGSSCVSTGDRRHPPFLPLSTPPTLPPALPFPPGDHGLWDTVFSTQFRALSLSEKLDELQQGCAPDILPLLSTDAF